MYRCTSREKRKKRENLGERVPATPDLDPCHFKTFDCNNSLDCDTKATIVEASPSVVALISYSDSIQLIQGCGTIIERHDDTIIVLTSANLIRRPTSEPFGENTLADNITVHAHLCGGDLYEGGEVHAYDFHYNIAFIRFSFVPKVAKVARINDSIDVRSRRTSWPLFCLLPHSRSCKLTPGDRIIIMGRSFAEPFEPMAAPGEYCLEQTTYDCKELFTTSCKITKCGDGGPVINSLGELIGVAFHDTSVIPCLPIKIAYKWWEHYKEYGKCCRPFLGLEATNLVAADLGLIARVIHNFPDAYKGLLVEKIEPDSSADLAGLFVNDVIIKCDGKPVESFLEFFGMIWEKVGVPIELILVRVDDVTPIQVNMVFNEATSDQLNRWPAHIKD
ncbi:Protease Do-like 14-like protein [Heracleum sosnowskyi]|uniref:Protease Do-like 14-like protein n=1 Tax=Heracleum sosnowskyi TaxID=360622 RepID=A0AAD8I8Z1_9APIA|nr:Protease Do-like 14-like protein [Heracleum sosnowskyi]